MMNFSKHRHNHWIRTLTAPDPILANHKINLTTKVKTEKDNWSEDERNSHSPLVESVGSNQGSPSRLRNHRATILPSHLPVDKEEDYESASTGLEPLPPTENIDAPHFSEDEEEQNRPPKNSLTMEGGWRRRGWRSTMTARMWWRWRTAMWGFLCWGNTNVRETEWNETWGESKNDKMVKIKGKENKRY